METTLNPKLSHPRTLALNPKTRKPCTERRIPHWNAKSAADALKCFFETVGIRLLQGLFFALKPLVYIHRNTGIVATLTGTNIATRTLSHQEEGFLSGLFVLPDPVVTLQDAAGFNGPSSSRH